MDVISQKVISIRKMLILIVLSALAVLLSWGTIRFWLQKALLIDQQIVSLIDILLIFVIGLVVIILLTQLITRSVAVHTGSSQTNTIRLLFQLVSFSTLLLIVFSMTGINLVGALVGVGFFGIVVGLAAQAVLGNLFSGLMLVAFRPFKIGDRIALITWQYGKFPPSLSHGWLEPAYTGTVKEVTLMYTRIATDSHALITVPNGVVFQSLILDPQHEKHSYTGTQFEVPINVDPDELHKNLNSQLSKMPDFKGKEENFEIIEMSSSSYVLAINYRVEKNHEQNMKSFLLRAIRLALVNTSKTK